MTGRLQSAKPAGIRTIPHTPAVAGSAVPVPAGIGSSRAGTG